MTQNIWLQENYIKALKFAANAHRNQTVPGTDLPYLVHLNCVSMEIMTALHTEKERDGNLAVQCALLHDVIEDTTVTYPTVANEFGEAVANGVLALSKDKTLPKPQQMADSLHRIQQQPPEIWMVKLADRITNLQPPPSYWTTDKAKRYQTEALEILHTLGRASTFLAARLQDKINAYEAHT